MFGFLKKLVGKEQPAVTQPAPAPIVPELKSPVVPAAPRPEPAVVQPPVAPAPRLTPPPASAPMRPEPIPAPPPTVNFSGAVIEVPLRQVFPKFHPAIIKSAARQPKPDDMLKLPEERVLPQLVSGSVKFTFQELRQIAPSGFFGPNDPEGVSSIEIPLAELLRYVNPTHMRRRGQRKIEVPDEIGPIFGTGSPNLRVVAPVRPGTPPTPPPAPMAPSPAPAPISAPVPPPPAPVPPPPPTPVAQAPAAIPAPTPAPSPIRFSPAEPPKPAEPIKAPKLDPALASLGRPAEIRATFKLPLMDIASYWSSTGKTELSNLYRHEAEMPLELVEAGLKKGKLSFPWKQFREWMRLAPGATLPQIPDETPIELPLSIVAPRFLEAHAPKRTQRKVAVAEDIPDLFEAKKPVAAPPVLATPPVPEPPATAVPTAPKGVPEYGEIFGQPEKKTWTLPEVLQSCSTLRGVAGALIATSDGLLVAGSWPGDVKGESVAAFIPQMHKRMSQYSKELKLGEPASFTLMFDDVPVRILRAGNSFLTILGRSGETLPTEPLAAVAAQLSQQIIPS